MPSNTCQFVKENGERCRRSAAAGQKYCWQHSRGLWAKWHSLTRNQTIAFYVGMASLAATLWFGIRSLGPKSTANQAIHVQSSGDQSPNVVDNKGKVEIQNQQPSGQQQKNGKSSAGKKQ